MGQRVESRPSRRNFRRSHCPTFAEERTFSFGDRRVLGVLTTDAELAATDATLGRAYFTHPRPIYELFDLDEDPSELNNLAGRADLANVERELRKALIEKCVLDYDFIPPPVLN